jgi:hypothetical protein
LVTAACDPLQLYITIPLFIHPQSLDWEDELVVYVSYHAMSG